MLNTIIALYQKRAFIREGRLKDGDCFRTDIKKNPALTSPEELNLKIERDNAITHPRAETIQVSQSLPSLDGRG